MRRLISIIILLITVMSSRGEVRADNTAPRRLLDFRLRTPGVATLAPGNRFNLIRPANDELLLHDYFKNSAITSSSTYLTASPERLMGLQRFELSRGQSALRGAEMASSLGLFFGAVGNTFGMFDEDVTWALVGAAGLAGAIWGATEGYDDPAWRVRFRWED